MNLKTAARRLGVHYQTAYRWVRTGQLVAVKVGAGYEISDAALGRFQAQRAALERIPDVTPRTTTVVPSARADALTMLDVMVGATMTDAGAVFQQSAHMIAAVVGDAASLHLHPSHLPGIRGYGTGPLPGSDDARALAAFDHNDPARAVMLGAVLQHGRTDDRAYAERAERTLAAVLVPQVPQREVRAMLRPEFHQALGDVGFYSAVSVPVVAGGRVCGSLFAGRDTPGRPYTTEDRDFVAAIAARVGVAASRAEHGRHAWALRARIASDLAERTGQPNDVVLAADWLGSSVSDNGAVAIVDLEMRVVTATKGFAVLLGSTVPDVAESLLADVVAPADEARATFARMTAGELDFCSFVTRGVVEPPTTLVLDGAIVRGPDATPSCIVYVAHERPEAPSD